MKLTTEQGWRKGDLNQLCKNLHPRDREECRFITTHLPSHIQAVLEDMGDACCSVHDGGGRLWWMGGVAPCNIDGWEDRGFAWLLKTKWAKPKFKRDKLVLRDALSKVLDLARDKTEYNTIGNIIWDQQKVNIKWLESEGFFINYDEPGTVTRENGVQGTFYQFVKHIRRDSDGVR